MICGWFIGFIVLGMIIFALISCLCADGHTISSLEAECKQKNMELYLLKDAQRKQSCRIAALEGANDRYRQRIDKLEAAQKHTCCRDCSGKPRTKNTCFTFWF